MGVAVATTPGVAHAAPDSAKTTDRAESDRESVKGSYGDPASSTPNDDDADDADDGDDDGEDDDVDADDVGGDEAAGDLGPSGVVGARDGADQQSVSGNGGQDLAGNVEGSPPVYVPPAAQSPVVDPTPPVAPPPAQSPIVDPTPPPAQSPIVDPTPPAAQSPVVDPPPVYVPLAVSEAVPSTPRSPDITAPDQASDTAAALRDPQNRVAPSASTGEFTASAFAVTVAAPGGDTSLAAAAAPGTPSPAPLIDQPDNVWEVAVAAPAVLANIAITAVNAFLSSVLTPGPTTPAPPVMLFVMLGWVQRELQRTFFNQSPTAVTDVVTTSEGFPTTFPVLGNDIDLDVNSTPGTFPGDTLTVTDYTQPAHGVVALNPDGTFTYTPDADFAGNDSFSYTVSDEASPWHLHGFAGLFSGGGHASTTTVAVTVTPVNDAPVAVDDGGLSVGEDTSLSVSAASLVANDVDIDGGPLTVTAVGNAQGGTVALSNGIVTFIPTANYFGPASFEYTVSDGQITDVGTVAVTVTPVNDAPVAVDDGALSVGEDTSLSVSAASLVANDVDIDGGPLTVTAVGNAQGGTVALSNGIVTFTPTANYFGPASFDYTVSDGSLTDVGTVAVTVAAVNDAPVATGHTIAVPEDSISTVNLTADSADPDGDALTAVLVSGPTNAQTFILNPDRTFTYTPAANYTGQDSFTYKVNDGALDSNTVTVTINVTAENDAPTAVDDGPFALDEDGSRTLTAAELLGNDTDPDTGDVLHVAAVNSTAGTHGTVVLNPDGTVTYTPTADYNGPAEFTYTVADLSNTPSANTATVTLFVTPVDDTAVHDGPVVAVGLNASGQTDIPPPPDGLTYAEVEGGYYHTVLLLSDGTAVSVGNNGWGQSEIPALPADVTYTEVAAGYLHTVLLRSDGTAVAVGDNAYGQTAIPEPPEGMFYTDVAAGGFQTVLLRSDGTAIALGDNAYGQTDIPALPPGEEYTGIAAGANHTVLLRSDGAAVAFGNSDYGQLDIPELPEGMIYTDAAVGNAHTVLLRSDGTVVAVGWPRYGQTDIPELPEGMEYTDIAAGFDHTVLLRSDGTVIAVGRNDLGQTNVPAPPPGVIYADVAAGDWTTVLLTDTIIV
ncbi:tandem-95 repeat protein [Mycobacterium manitobense]|uniref:Tandem-95 repeat protein n=1 Tax=[Mycobacterium] manitobense TaxID=190147 RepID=A0A9X3BYV7_9MYCO|nr:Ig-like domain-containing protein [[Mycobacterium] manitobense]MCV7172382.1 tandem-95 repeat protein [[Mycobacterium] manitobense]